MSRSRFFRCVAGFILFSFGFVVPYYFGGIATSSITTTRHNVESSLSDAASWIRDTWSNRSLSNGSSQLLKTNLRNGTYLSKTIGTSNSTKATGIDKETPTLALKSEKDLPLCPETPPNLVGTIKLELNSTPSWQDLYTQIKGVSKGGFWSPPHCKARHRVAIVIPFRDRDEHLRLFLKHMHPFLQRQELEYGIYVVEQAMPSRFNRAMLINIGYVHANKLHTFDCVVFHDVDLIPENDKNIYSCPDNPRHLSIAIEKYKYKLPYKTIFGGAGVIKNKHFEKMNGTPNRYFGWGGEDDDLYKRVIYAGLKLIRYPMNIGRYKMALHKKEKAASDRMKKLSAAKQFAQRDGLNSLKYDVLGIEERKLYTWVFVDLDEKQGMKRSRIPWESDDSCHIALTTGGLTGAGVYAPVSFHSLL